MQELLVDTRWEIIKNKCKLEEGDNMCVNIKELPSIGLKISIPSGAHFATMKQKYLASCDYLILMPENEYIDLYFIELKKTFQSKAYKQILSTVPIWDYFVSAIKIHFHEQAKIIEKYKFRKHFVVIAETRHPKRDKQSKNRPTDEIEHKNEIFKVITHLKNISIKKLKCQTRS